jgi:deoxyhypusine synthase
MSRFLLESSVPRLDLTKLKTYPLASRRSNVNMAAFARVCRKGSSFRQFYESLPDFLAARDLKRIVTAIVEARLQRKPFLWMMGAHVIKVGLNPLLIDMVRRKVITAIALNGAGGIHDFELA